jgi:hypothetical protein
MITALRGQLRDLIGTASHLDGLLAEAAPLPDLEAARALVEFDRLKQKLAKAADRLGEVVTPLSPG